MPSQTTVFRTQAVLWHATGARLGESPRWNPWTKQVHWIDIDAGNLWTAELDGGQAHCRFLGAPLGAIALGRRSMAFAVGGQWWRLTSEDAVHGPWTQLEHSLLRFNDCGVDVQGKLWSASMRRDEVLTGAPLGGLYDCSSTPPVERLSGLAAGNAIAWSPDDCSMYVVDSGPNHVLKIPFNPRGGPTGAPAVWLQCSDAAGDSAGGGLADGMAVDSQGGVWLALWGSGEVRRFGAEGVLTAVIKVPTPQVTALCFAGENLQTLIITTAATGLENSGDALAGHTFAAPSPVPGLRLHSWEANL